MNDLMTIQRYVFKPNWTLSRYYVNGVLSGFGVEDEVRLRKVHGETAIPYGRYPLGHRQSPRFSRGFYYHDDRNQLISRKDYLRLPDKNGWRAHDLIWLLNIPNFQYVLIHWGNTDLDTDGCYIVGNKIGIVNGREGVTESRNNYRKLYTKIYPLVRTGNQFIHIVDAL